MDLLIIIIISTDIDIIIEDSIIDSILDGIINQGSTTKTEEDTSLDIENFIISIDFIELEELIKIKTLSEEDIIIIGIITPNSITETTGDLIDLILEEETILIIDSQIPTVIPITNTLIRVTYI